jgi:hypothetical protein
MNVIKPQMVVCHVGTVHDTFSVAQPSPHLEELYTPVQYAILL